MILRAVDENQFWDIISEKARPISCSLDVSEKSKGYCCVEVQSTDPRTNRK